MVFVIWSQFLKEKHRLPYTKTIIMEKMSEDNMLNATGEEIYEVTVGSALDTAWSSEEKERLLQAMRLYGLEDEEVLSKCVMTKTTNQVHAFIDSRYRKARRTQVEAYSLIENKAPIDMWRDITIMLQSGKYKPKDFSLLLGNVMKNISEGAHTAPDNFCSPNYERIYQFLGCMLRGVPPLDLSPTDSFIVLQLIKMLGSLMKGLDLDSQKQFLKQHAEAERHKSTMRRSKGPVDESAEGHIDPLGGAGEAAGEEKMIVPDTAADHAPTYMSPLFNPSSTEPNSLNVLNLPPDILHEMTSMVHHLDIFSGE